MGLNPDEKFKFKIVRGKKGEKYGEYNATGDTAEEAQKNLKIAKALFIMHTSDDAKEINEAAQTYVDLAKGK